MESEREENGFTQGTFWTSAPTLITSSGLAPWNITPRKSVGPN